MAAQRLKDQLDDLRLDQGFPLPYPYLVIFFPFIITSKSEDFYSKVTFLSY